MIEYSELIIRIITLLFLLRIYIKANLEYKYKKRSESVYAVMNVFGFAIFGVTISIILSIFIILRLSNSYIYHIFNILWHIINILAVNYSLRFVYVVFPRHPKDFMEQIVHNITSILIGLSIGNIFFLEIQNLSMLIGVLILFSSTIVAVYSRKSYKVLKQISELEMKLYYIGSIFFIISLIITLLFINYPLISLNATYFGQILNANYIYKSFFNKRDLQRRLYSFKSTDLSKFFNIKKKERFLDKYSITNYIIKKIRQKSSIIINQYIKEIK